MTFSAQQAVGKKQNYGRPHKHKGNALRLRKWLLIQKYTD